MVNLSGLGLHYKVEGCEVAEQARAAVHAWLAR